MKWFALPMLGALALFPASARAHSPPKPQSAHERYHDQLEHRDFHRELDHRDAHRYPMTWRQHDRLHDVLEHDASHDRLQHRQFHREYYRPSYRSYYPYRGYGFGFDNGGISFWYRR